MSALIYDTATSSFKDSEIPKVWDENVQAFVDAQGLVWDKNSQAWVDAWSNGLDLYMIPGSPATESGTLTGASFKPTKTGFKYEGHRYQGTDSIVSIVFNEPIDLTLYTKITGKITTTTDYNYNGHPIFGQVYSLVYKSKPARHINSNCYIYNFGDLHFTDYGGYYKVSSVTDYSFTQDISSITGLRYVGFGIGNEAQNSTLIMEDWQLS